MKKRYLAWCLVLSLISGTCLHLEAAAAKTLAVAKKPVAIEQLNEAEDAYEDTLDKKDSAQDSLNELNSQKDSLEAALDDLTEKLEQASNILEELDASIEAKREQIDATWGRIEELAMQIDETQELADSEYELAKEQIKFAYESGDTLEKAILLGAGDYSMFINRGSYMQMLTDYRQSKIQALSKTKELLEDKQGEYQEALIELEKEKTELDEYEKRVEEQHEEISNLIDITARKVRQYESQIEDTENRLRKYEEKLETQQNDIAKLRSQLKEEKEKSTQAASAEWKDVSNVDYTNDDRKLLANIIWCEAGDEPYEGQVAVGAVVMNRVSSTVFPNTISGVIYQKKQFSPAGSGRLSLALTRDSATESCYRAADAALAGVNNVGSCLYFRTPTSSVSPVYVIGGHYFY